MRKITILLLIVSMTVLLAGCGSGGSAESETTLEFKKNGQVVHTIVEDFSADYYDLDELETDVKSQIEEYNTRVGSDPVSYTHLQACGDSGTDKWDVFLSFGG